MVSTCVSASRSFPPIYSFTDVWVAAAFCMEPPRVNRSHFYTPLTPSLQCLVCILNRSGGFLYPNPPPPPLDRWEGKRWKGTFFKAEKWRRCGFVFVCAEAKNHEHEHELCKQIHSRSIRKSPWIDVNWMPAKWNAKTTHTKKKSKKKKTHNSFLALFVTVWESICAPFARALTCVMKCKLREMCAFLFRVGVREASWQNIELDRSQGAKRLERKAEIHYYPPSPQILPLTLSAQMN